MNHPDSNLSSAPLSGKKNITIYRLISIIIGAFLVFSAFAKTQPITSFIGTLSNTFNIEFAYLEVMAQFIIAVEAGLGIALILGLLGKNRWILWASQIMFIAFTLFILFIWYRDGDNADCGCMGEMVKLSPMATLLKNVALILLTFFLIARYKKEESRSRQIFPYVIIVIMFAYTLLFYPAELNVDKLYEEHPEFSSVTNDQQSVDFREGQHIMAFMSLTCGHCKEAARILSEIHHQDPGIPVVFIFSEKHKDKKDLLEAFDDNLEYKGVPVMFMPHDMVLYLAGNSVPSIYFITDKVIDKKADNYTQIKLKDVQEWMNKK